MRTVEHLSDLTNTRTNTRVVAFCHRRAERAKKRFDVAPRNVGANRIDENRGSCALLARVERHLGVLDFRLSRRFRHDFHEVRV